MSKTVNLSFKVPEEIHKKLKVISALSGKAMNEIIIDFVKKQKVSIPTFNDEPEKTKIRTVENSQADNPVLRERILTLKADGLSFQKIAETLDVEGFETARGGKWFKGTISNMLKRWEQNNA